MSQHFSKHKFTRIFAEFRAALATNNQLQNEFSQTKKVKFQVRKQRWLITHYFTIQDLTRSSLNTQVRVNF